MECTSAAGTSCRRRPRSSVGTQAATGWPLEGDGNATPSHCKPPPCTASVADLRFTFRHLWPTNARIFRAGRWQNRHSGHGQGCETTGLGAAAGPALREQEAAMRLSPPHSPGQPAAAGLLEPRHAPGHLYPNRPRRTCIAPPCTGPPRGRRTLPAQGSLRGRPLPPSPKNRARHGLDQPTRAARYQIPADRHRTEGGLTGRRPWPSGLFLPTCGDTTHT